MRKLDSLTRPGTVSWIILSLRKTAYRRDKDKTGRSDSEELDEKVRQFDQARDSELDNIEFEKDSLQERQRQDR